MGSRSKINQKILIPTVGDQILSYEELQTVVTQVEACVNSRPLCPLSDDVNSFDALTPGHFLIGDAILALSPRPIRSPP